MPEPEQQSSPRAPGLVPGRWIQRLLILGACVGPIVGWIAGSSTANDLNWVELTREAIQAVQGPLGALVLALLCLGAQSWYLLRTISRYEALLATKSQYTWETLQLKDQKIEAGAEKTIKVFEAVVGRYERVLREVNTRSDQIAQQLNEALSILRRLGR